MLGRNLRWTGIVLFLLTAAAPAARAALLHDNGPLVNSPGTGAGGADECALQTALGMNTIGYTHSAASGSRVADDFTVTDPSGWFLDQITFYAYQTGAGTSPSTITGVNYQVWSGPPNDAASAVIWGDDTTNRLVSSSWSYIYRVIDTSPGNTQRPIMANTVSAGFHLPPGTYWLSWQTTGTLPSGPFAPPVTIGGQTTTGDALQYNGASWVTANDVGPQGFPFLVQGIPLLLFSDDFSDGSLAGDPQWTEVRGAWSVGTPSWHGDPIYFSSARRRALSLVTGLSAAGARIETLFGTGRTLRRRSVSFVFDYQDPLHYRSVELRQLAGRRWQLLLRQKGAFDGDVAGVKATAILPAFDRKVMHQLRIDAPAAGAVQVSIDGELVFAGIFAGPSSGGGIGLASDLTGLYADSFTVFHEALVGSD